MQLHTLMCSVAMILVVLGIAVAKDTKDSKKKLQIGIKKRVDADKCKIKSRKGDVLSMHYTWYVPSRQKLANPFYLVSMSGEVKYPTPEGKLEDGTDFDSSIPRGEPFVFTLGSGQVIKGWDQGLLGMCEGEKRKLVIPSDMGYGDRGAPPKIPGGATLVFEVELLSIERKDEL